MRGLAKLEKNANKKLKGKRKRQHETLATNVTGQDFKIDATDTRFAALLDGDDDRFGIDRTNPAYKETGAMKELLQEQSNRRKKKRAKTGTVGDNSSSSKKEKATDASRKDNSHDGDGGWVDKSSGAMELSSLVMSLQQKVSKVEKPKSKRKNRLG